MEHFLRGAIAAMAMTGMRRVTTGLGLVREVPPEDLFERGAPELLAQIPAERRDAVIELAHWAFGAAAGAAFALLPRRAREATWGGPAYGLGIWALFETVGAPLLGLRRPRERSASERAALAADHVLYGFVVAGRPRGARRYGFEPSRYGA
jgi:hypothetical protein